MVFSEKRKTDKETGKKSEKRALTEEKKVQEQGLEREKRRERLIERMKEERVNRKDEAFGRDR